MNRRRTTRDDVARLAGTSTAVVSYVINDGPRNVSEERRARVLSAMATLDYHPNAIARSLAATETRTVGMIVPNISNSYFSELSLEVEEAAAQRERLLFVGNSNEDPKREDEYISSFLEQQVDAIIIIGVAQSSSVRRAFSSGVSVVVVDRAIEGSHATTVSIDHRAAAFTATQHLIEHGHTAIACLGGPKDQSVAQDRERGWADALTLAGIDPAEQVQLNSPFSLAGGSAAAERLWTEPGITPTAVFVASDEQARGLLAAVPRGNRHVPTDLAITSVDGTREGEFTNPALTTVRQPFSLIAEKAISFALAGDRPEPGHVVVGSDLVIRQSCGCA